MINTKTYDNGLRIVVENMPNFETCSLRILVKAGACNEQNYPAGISHFLEHAFFLSTKNKKATFLNKELDYLGVSRNAYTNHFYTCYWSKVIGENLEKCAGIMAEMFFNEDFLENELLNEKKVVCEEIAKSDDVTGKKCYWNMRKAFYNGTSLAGNVLGTCESVNSITKADLIRYRNEFYLPKNIIISFAGNITFEDAQRLTEEYFIKNLKNSNNENLVLTEEKILKERVVFEAKDISQSVVCVAYPALHFTEHFEAINLLEAIIGGSHGSKLEQFLRNNVGLVYSANTEVALNNVGGEFIFNFATTAEKLKLALQTLRKLINYLKKNGVNEEEVEIFKRFIITRVKMAKENTHSVSGVNATSLLYYNKSFTREEIIERYKKVTVQEINDLIQAIFKEDSFVISCIGKPVDYDLLKCFNLEE